MNKYISYKLAMDNIQNTFYIKYISKNINQHNYYSLIPEHLDLNQLKLILDDVNNSRHLDIFSKLKIISAEEVTDIYYSLLFSSVFKHIFKKEHILIINEEFFNQIKDLLPGFKHISYIDFYNEILLRKIIL